MSSDVLSKLSRLNKSPSRRRVMGANDLEEEENYVPDLRDIGGSETTALPESEVQQSVVSPEQFDVRANRTPEQEAFSKIGNHFGGSKATPSMVETITENPDQNEPIADDRARIASIYEKEKEKLASQPYAPPEDENRGILDKIGNYFKKIYTPSSKEEIAQNLIEMEKPVLGKSSDLGAKEYAEKNNLPIFEKQSEEFNKNIDEAQKAPWSKVVYGASDEIANSPELQANFSEIAGVDWTPELSKQLSEYEAAMSEIEQGYQRTGEEINGHIERIKERIETNTATDNDKYYIGLALLAPLIVGGFFGVEAGLATLGGGLEGLAKSKLEGQKQVSGDLEEISNLLKLKSQNDAEQANVRLKKAALPQEMMKSLQKDEIAHLKGMDLVTWTDPNTGEKKEGVQVRPGFLVSPGKAQNEKEFERLGKAADKIIEKKDFSDELNDISSDIVHIASKLDDPALLYKAFVALSANKLPGSLSTLTPDIEWEGRKVNAGLLLEEKIGFLANAYAQAKKLGQLDRAAQNHLDKIFLNPTKTLSKNEDLITQMLEARKLSQRDILKSAQNAGFDISLLKNEIANKNRELYALLNKKEQNKRVEETTKELSR